MYPSTASKVPVSGTSLVAALVAAQLLSHPPPAQLAVQVLSLPDRRILLFTPDEQQEYSCPDAVWQALMPLLHSLVQQQQLSLAQILQTALLIAPNAKSIALAEPTVAQSWVAGSRTRPAASRKTAQQAPPAASVDPSDDPATVPLVAHDSLQMVEVDTRFDPALLYERRRVPPGVRVVGIDIFCTSIHWMNAFLPAGFAPLFEQYQPPATTSLRPRHAPQPHRAIL